MARRWDAGRGLAALACAAAVAVSARQARGDEVPRVVVLDSPGVRPFDEPIRAQTVSTVALGPATVTMPAGGAIVWSPRTASIELVDGEVNVTVDPALHQHFRVATSAFVVDVVGTEFTVTPGEVSVWRGTVRITRLDGTVIVERLEAGQSWQPESAAPPVDDDIAAVRREPAPRPEPTAAERLSEARRAFVAGDIDAAGDAARAVLALRGATRRQKADASTLEADCAQASGQPARAIELYRSIADQYRDLPAGETALFAAGRLDANRGRKAAARRHLELYLARYPDGRFASDARARLRALGER